jgi:hypothetical protein
MLGKPAVGGFFFGVKEPRQTAGLPEGSISPVPLPRREIRSSLSSSRVVATTMTVEDTWHGRQKRSGKIEFDEMVAEHGTEP